jgi:hypothetical protein
MNTPNINALSSRPELTAVVGIALDYSLQSRKGFILGDAWLWDRMFNVWFGLIQRNQA